MTTDEATCCSSSPAPAHVQEWVRGRLLGSGSFGRVNAAVSTVTGSLFAVKSVVVSPEDPRRSAVNLRVLENEIEILASLHCPEIIQCLGSSWTQEEVTGTERGCIRTCRNLHLELASGGSIAGLLKDTGAKGLAEGLLRRYTHDVTRALQYMHTRGIVHGDVKGLNILIGDTSAKLADFGTAWRVDSSGAATASASSEMLPSPRMPTPLPISRLLSRSSSFQTPPSRSISSHIMATAADACCSVDTGDKTGTNGSGFRREQRRELKGSPYWMSPETVRERPYQGTAVDIWSLGCTVLEMATGKAPWSEVKGGLCAVLYAIGCTDNLPVVPETLPPLVRDFIACCLRRDPQERWTAAQLLQHPFLTGNAELAQSHRIASHLLHSREKPESVDDPMEGSEQASHRRTHSCHIRPDPVSMLECLSSAGGGCSSVPFSGASVSPGSKCTNRKRGFSPLGCMVLEKAQACKSEFSGTPAPAAGAEFSPKRKRAGEEDTMTSSFPLLDLSLLKDKLPPGGSMLVGAASPIWPNSPLSQQGAGWIVVHSPKRGSNGLS